MHRLLAFLALATFVPLGYASAQATTVFRGTPSVRVTEGGTDRTPENLTHDKAGNLGVVISRIGDRYYWASRENKEMVRREFGAFITYIAVDGAGYVRLIAPGKKQAASLLGPSEEKFDYVEHLTMGLRSITYYGAARHIE